MIAGVRLEQNQMVMALEDPYAEEGDEFGQVMEVCSCITILKRFGGLKAVHSVYVGRVCACGFDKRRYRPPTSL